MNCKIKTTTIQTDLFEISLYQNIGSFEELEAQIKECSHPQDSFTTYADGTITTKNGTTYIKYEDNEELGTEKTKTEISFKNDTPDEIFISRKGSLDSDLIFVKGKSCNGVLTTPFMPFEYTMHTKEVKNRLYSENYLEIIYYIQVKGAQVEKTFLRIEVER